MSIFRIWPQLVAEELGLPEKRDPASFASRLGTHLERLAILDVNYRRPSGGVR